MAVKVRAASEACDSEPMICQNQTMNLTALRRWIAGSALLLQATLAIADPGLSHADFRVLHIWPHSPADSTQGLEFVGDQLLESTGRYGESRLLLREWRSGRLLAKHELDERIFGEGATRVGDQFWQLSWRSGRGWIYDSDLQPLRSFRYRGQGWGLCYDGQRLVRSDGTDQLLFHSATDFAQLGSVSVTLNGQPMPRLNELECVNGLVYANVWQRDLLLQIDPNSGVVQKYWDLEALRYRFRPPAGFSPSEDVLNGIAFHPVRQSFFVTGKRWPVLFELELQPNRTSPADHP